MRILIDMQWAQIGSHDRGIGRSLRELISVLIRQYPESHFILHFDSSMPATVCQWQADALAALSNVEISRWSMPRGIDRQLFYQARWREVVDRLYTAAIERVAPDIVLIPSFFERGVVVNLSQRKSAVPCVVLIHDLISLTEPRGCSDLGQNTEAEADHQRRLEELKKADHLVCSSASIAQEVAQWLGIHPSRTTPIWTDAELGDNADPALQAPEQLTSERERVERPCWHRAAVRTMNVLQRWGSPEARAQRRPSAVVSKPGDKPKLAFVSPLPPAHTGIANYSEELLPALSEHYCKHRTRKTSLGVRRFSWTVFTRQCLSADDT